MGNPYLERAEKTKNLSNSHRRSKRQEAEVARRYGGAVTPASGAKAIKGDVRVKGVVRIECKTTKNKSFSVTREMIDKIEDAVVGTDEMPVLIVEFTDGLGKKLKEVAVIPTYALSSLGMEYD